MVYQRSHCGPLVEITLSFLLYNPASIRTVSSNEHSEIRRLMLRDNLTLQEAQDRIAAQMPISEKISRATYLIDNNGD